MPMTEKDIEALHDIQGFIDWSIDNGVDLSWCLAGIGHDLGIIKAHSEDGSSPRTFGYAKYKKQ